MTQQGKPPFRYKVEMGWFPIERARQDGLTAILGWAPGWDHAQTLVWFDGNDAWGQESDSGRLTVFEPMLYRKIPDPLKAVSE